VNLNERGIEGYKDKKKSFLGKEIGLTQKEKDDVDYA